MAGRSGLRRDRRAISRRLLIARSPAGHGLRRNRQLSVIAYARMSETRAWDGHSYDRISGVMAAMGLGVLDRLELAGDETVLDAGCGSGRVTEALLQRLPNGRVIALDASESMVAAARERLAGAGSRVEVRRGDLLALELDPPADAIFSTATFHWITDHDRLFARLHAALVPGGRLVGAVRRRGQHHKAARRRRAGARTRTLRAGVSSDFSPRGTTRAPSPPTHGCWRPASRRPSAGLRRRPSSPSTPASFSRRSCSARTCSTCRRTSASPLSRTCSPSLARRSWSTTCA